ncbi:hypothetical protein RU639_005204 [Aspergillus parasiticus]
MGRNRNAAAQGVGDGGGGRGRGGGGGCDRGAIKKVAENKKQMPLLWRKGAQLAQLPADGGARGLGADHYGGCD